MATVSNRPVGFQSRACAGCNAALFVPVPTIQPLCRNCQKGQVLYEIGKMMSDIAALREGTGIFAALDKSERDEQLAALGLPAVESKPLYPGFRTMDSDRLIRIVSGEDLFTLPGEDPNTAVAEALVELCKRLDSPTPAERAEIETRDEIETIDIGDEPQTHEEIERRLTTLDALDHLTPQEEQAYSPIHR